MTASPLRRIDWLRALLYTHRWLGIAGGALFVVWFATGIVMMYARMPSLDPVARLRRMPALDVAAIRVGAADAARAAVLDVPPERLRIAMLGERPVYRFAHGARWVTVFADDGAPLDALTAGGALRLARSLHPEHATTIRHERRLEEPDQWTLQSRGFLPLHRVALGDGDDTRVYVSERTGEPVMSTTRRERRWAYLGAVPHWLYFTALRSRSALWLQSMLWLSIAGCALTLSGLLWGIRQVLPAARGRRAGSSRSPGDGAAAPRAHVEGAHGVAAPLGHAVSRLRSPHVGWMRWHHYAGLVFGLFAFTWILSGCLSLDPWDWHPGTAPTTRQRAGAAGGPLRLDVLTPERLQAANAALASVFPPKELEVVQLEGEPFLIAHHAPAVESAASATTRGRYDVSAFLDPAQPLEHRVVAVLHPERGAFTRFDDDAALAGARAAMPGASLVDAAWLADYDAYYYDRDRARPLPVLRARFDDPGRTWLYLDPGRGVLLHKEETRSRVNRWLYRGLHSFDFPFLHDRRPLWDVVVIVLCAGGILLASSSAADGWRRLGRHLRRAAGGGRGGA